MIQQKKNWWDEDETVTPTTPAKTAAPVKAPVKQQGNWWDDDEDAVPVAKTAPKPAPMSQPDATPWGDGQAFDDMYARKPQTDPMNMPLMPGARTLTSGQPTQMKPPPVPRGPVMSPAQRRATQPARDAAVAQRTEQANRWKTDSPFGTPVDEMGMPIAVADAQRDGGMYAVRDDVGKAIVASPIHAERALVGAAEATLNTPGDLGRSLAVPFAMGFDPASQGIVANLEFARDEASVANAMDRFATRYEQGGFRDAQEKIEAAPRFNFSAAKIPVPKELESFSGTLAEGFLQYLAARGALGKFMPGGKSLAQFAKDVGATGIGYSGDSPRAADMLDPESMGMLSDYVRWLKTQPGDTQGMGRFKNMAEDATINLLAMGLLRGGQATTNALNPQALTPTNAGGARLGQQPAPAAPPVGAMQPPAQPQPVPPQTARQPAQPAQGPAPQPTPPPQAATAPPVPPVPPAAPAATAAAPQPTPAAVAPQPARQALGPAEQAVNAMPRKTREALWRALSNSGMNRQQAEAAVRSLNDLPEGQNSMFDFELVRRFGQQYPRLKTNLQAMGRDWAITIPKDPRKGSPNRVLDDNTSTQIKSEGEFIDRTAQEVFGQPVNDTLDALGAGKRQLSAQYNSLLDFENPYGPNINRMRGQNKIKRMQEIDGAIGRLTSYLQRPEVMSEVPDWVRDRVMLDVGKDMRERLSDSAFLGYMRLNSPDLANLLQQGTPLRYSDDLWKQITTLYPTQAAHSLQSAYARAIRDALKGTDVEQRTAAEILIRKRGGSRVRANAASPDKRGFGLLHYLEEAVPGYRDLRREYGDVIGAEDAAELPRDFFRIANDDVALKDWIEVKNDLSPQQQAALKSGMTTQIQQALRKKHETLDPWELDQPDALSTPNLTTLSQQPVLNALEKAFGADGKKMADAIRAASTRTDRIRSIHPNYGPRTALNQEATRNASNIYGDPWGSEQNVIDSVSGSLGAAGVLSALNPATAAAAPLLLTGAAAKGLWNQWKRNKQLTGEEAEALADFFFRSRRPDLAEQVRRPRGVSAGDYAGAALRDASIGTVAAAASDGDLLNNDPNLLLAGAAAGAGAGILRARGRDAASKIKPPPAPRGAGRRNPPPAGPGVGGPNAPRPLPGQTSPSSPVIGGAALGALTSGGATYAATGDEDAALKAGILGGIGGGVVGSRFGKGAKPKAPPAKAPGFDQRFMKEAQRIVQYNGGVKPAVKAQQYVIDQLVKNNASQDRINKAVSVRSAIERMAERSNRELDEIAATAPRSGPPGVKPPPVKMGFGGGKPSLPMDAASVKARGKAMGFDMEHPVYHGSGKGGGFDEFKTSERGRFGPGVYFSEQPGVAGKYGEAKPYVVPTTDQLFDAMPRWNSLSDDVEQRIIKQLKPNEREKLAALKNWYKREGEAFWEALRRSVDGDDKILADARASEVIQAAGFKGIRGIGDGQETVIFNPKNVRSPDAVFDPAKANSPVLKNGFGGRDLPINEGGGSLIEADAIGRIASGRTVPTSAELDDALKGLREAEFADLVRQFGGDRQKAEKFRSLWRQAENAPTRQEADMLDAQRQKLIEGMPDVEPREFVDEYALRQLRDAFRDIENGNAVKALNDSMTDLPTLREVQDGKISSRAQAALAILRKATQEARLQGLDPKQMMNSALESYGRRFSDPVDAEFMVGEVKKLFATFDPSQEQSSKLLAGMGGNSRGIADNLKQDAALAAFGSVGGSFANQDDPQAGALGGMGLALAGKYGGRAVNAMRGAGRVKPPPVRGAAQGKFRGPSQQTFAGVNAKTADKVALARAQNMEAEGAGRDAIWDETGWFKGVDGKWRFEIDDSGAFVKGGDVSASETSRRWGPSFVGDHSSGAMYHPELGTAYPALATDVTFGGRPGGGGQFTSASLLLDDVDTPWGGRVTVGDKYRGNEKTSVALHEGQHAVQAEEGFARGGNPKEQRTVLEQQRSQSVAATYDEMRSILDQADRNVYDAWNELVRARVVSDFDRAGQVENFLAASDEGKRLLDLDWKARSTAAGTVDEAKAYESYKRLAGESEARNVETRNAMRLRGEKPGRPWETQDVPDDQQIVRFGSGKAESRPKPPPKGQTGNALAGKPPKGPPKKPAPPKKAEEVALINALKKARTQETATRKRTVMANNRDELRRPSEEAVMKAERDLLEYRDRQFRQAAKGARWMDRGAAVANVGKKAAVATGNQIKKTMMKNDAELLKTYGVAVGGIAGIALGARALAGPDGDDEKKNEVLPPTDKRYFVETKLKKRPEMLGPVQDALVELKLLDIIDADRRWGAKTKDALAAYLSRKPDRLPDLPLQDYEVPALLAEAYGGYEENGKWFYNTGEPIVYPPRRNDTYLPARPLRPDEARRMAYDKRTEAERNNKVRP